MSYQDCEFICDPEYKKKPCWYEIFGYTIYILLIHMLSTFRCVCFLYQHYKSEKMFVGLNALIGGYPTLRLTIRGLKSKTAQVSQAPATIGPATQLTNPLPLPLSNFVGYAGNFSPL